MNKNEVIIILGMHRSGTSLLAAGLSHIGLPFGRELMGETEFNLKGHWEDNDIVAFNNSVLSALNLKWDSLDFIDPQSWNQKAILELIEEGKQLLKHKLSENNYQFAFKDPRTIRVLPVWLEILKRSGVTAKFIVSYRNPLDVSVSLSRREGKPLSFSQLLWMHHNFSYLEELLLSEHQVTFSEFYDFCKQPQKELSKLAKFLEVELNTNKAELFANQFYDEKLVSKQTDPYQLSENKKLFPYVLECYRHLRLMNGSHDVESNRLASANALNWKETGPFLCEQQQVLMQENLECQQDVRAQEQEKLQSAEQQVSLLKTQLQNTKDEQKAIELSELKRVLESQNVTAGVNLLADKLEYLINKNNQLNVDARLTELLEVAKQQHLEVQENNNNHLILVQNSLEKHSTSIMNELNKKEDYQEIKSHLLILQSKLETSEKLLINEQKNRDESIAYQAQVIQQLQLEKDESKAQAEHLKRVIDNLQSTLSEVKKSLSWRVTSPLRWLGKLFR